MTKYAIAPDPLPRGEMSYLTPGKKYEILSEEGENLFRIIDDEGDKITCLTHKCAHLGGDWIFEEEPTP